MDADVVSVLLFPAFAVGKRKLSIPNFTLLFSKSAINPILHCWKIKEVRRVMMEILQCPQM